MATILCVDDDPGVLDPADTARDRFARLIDAADIAALREALLEAASAPT